MREKRASPTSPASWREISPPMNVQAKIPTSDTVHQSRLTSLSQMLVSISGPSTAPIRIASAMIHAPIVRTGTLSRRLWITKRETTESLKGR